MARFLLTVWPLDSHVNPNIALAHALRERGHQVAFYTGGEAKTLVENEGYNCFPFQRVDFKLVHRALSSITLQRKLSWRTAALWSDFMLETVPAQAEDLKAIFKIWKPDVVVSDMAMWGPILISHEAESVPVVVFSHTAYCILRGKYGPIPGIALRHPRNLLAKFVWRCIATVVSLATSGVRRRGSKIRRAYGLTSLSTSANEFAGTLPLYLVPSTPKLDYERGDLPSSVHYVGSCLWDEAARYPVPNWVRVNNTQRARILVSEGTLFDSDSSLLQVAAKALANCGYEAILLAGKGRNIDHLRLGEMAPNVSLKPWTPLNAVLPSVSVVVCNGNSEIVLASLSQGVPMVMVPSMLDQPEMSWRVSDSGAGVRLSIRRCSPARMRAAVTLVMSDPQFRQNAARLGSQLAHRGGARRAAELLESLST